MSSHFPACFVELPPQCEGRRAAFYLAAEEYIAENLPEDSYFFTWQIGSTVVMGRNQVAQQEVNLDFCHRNGIDVCRRRSGGGAIFADERNIMTSLVTEGCAVEPLFQEYAEAVASALRKLGAPTEVSGRNDIVIRGEWNMENGERKICGNAFYHKINRNIAHGTMLYDTNPELMEGALHPEESKLEQRGVKSVRSRVGLLKDYLPFGVETLRQQLRLLLCNRSITLSAADVCEIERLEQRYYEEDFTLHAPLSTLHSQISRRIPGCGLVELYFTLHDGIIRDVQLTGDFFSLSDVQKAFKEALTGIPFTPEALTEAIRLHHPECSIRGLDETGIINLLSEMPVSARITKDRTE